MKKTIQAKIGEVVNTWITDVRRDSVAYNAIELLDNQFAIHAEDFTLVVLLEYTEETVEDEQKGDWYTPSYPAIKEYNITDIKAVYIEENGVEKPIPIFSNLRQLADLVLNRLIHE